MSSCITYPEIENFDVHELFLLYLYKKLYTCFLKKFISLVPSTSAISKRRNYSESDKYCNV